MLQKTEESKALSADQIKEKAGEMSTLRFFTEQDFGKIDAAVALKQIAPAKKGVKRPLQQTNNK